MSKSNYYQHAPNCLIIDDNELVLHIHANYLEALGCEVTLAKSGKEAIECINRKFEIIFLDIGLPDYHGWDIAALFRAAKYHKNTPIIAVTAIDINSSKQQEKLGFNDVLKKPVFQNTFARILSRYELMRNEIPHQN